MPKGKFQYLTLLLFVAGVSLIVFLQFNSGNSVNQLIGGNRQLLGELQLNIHLQHLQTEVMTLESDIRGAVITHDSTYLQSVQENVHGIRHQMNVIDSVISDEYSENLLTDLNRLLEKKIEFSNQVLRLYYLDDIPGAENLINTNRGKLLRDSITHTAQQLDITRQKNLSAIITSIDDNSERAHSWSLILAIVGSVICIAIFWFMIVQAQRQLSLINELHESQEALKKASHVKEQFMANMSHEIRTPLGTLLSYTRLMQKTSLNDLQQQYIKSIGQSGDNLLVIVNDILDLSKIEAGMLRIESVPFSPQQLIRELGQQFRADADHRKLLLSVTVGQKIPELLFGDPVRIHQIISNLLSNALKFTKQGHVSLTVQVASMTDEECRLNFMVADTGIGIAPENRGRIFDRFQQADDSTSRHFGGTGLGLSIVKQLCEILGGGIEVSDAPDGGSLFTVNLPFSLTGIDDNSIVLHTAEHPVHFNKSVRVLVAEDNPMNQQLIRHLFESQDLEQYDIAEDAVSTLEFLRKKRYDLLLMDLQLPGMDGLALTRRIREEQGEGLPIIALTAGMKDGEEQARAAGMNDYLLKPIDEDRLAETIARYAPPSGIDQMAGKLELIDLKYLERIAAGNAAFQKAMVQQFIRQVPEELLSLREAIDTLDYQAVHTRSHTLKSSVAFLGLSTQLQSLLEYLEEVESSTPRSRMRQMFEQVEKTCLQALREAEWLAALK